MEVPTVLLNSYFLFIGLPWRLKGEVSSCKCRRQAFKPPEKEMETHPGTQGSNPGTLAWKIPWTEEPGGLQSMGSQRWTWVKQLSMHTHTFKEIETIPTLIWKSEQSCIRPRIFHEFSPFSVLAMVCCDNYHIRFTKVFTNIITCTVMEQSPS